MKVYIVSDCAGFNILDSLKPLSIEEVQEIQKENTRPYAVATFNVMGDLNVGSIIRSSVIFGAEKVFVIGRKKYDRRSTVGAQNYIDIIFDQFDEKHEFESFLSVYGYYPVYIEQGGIDYQKMFDWFGFYDIRENESKPCFVFGSESHGIPFYLTAPNDIVVSIPQIGVLRSLNVSVAAGIILSHVSNKFSKGK